MFLKNETFIVSHFEMLKLCHIATQSYGHTATLLHGHRATQPHSYIATKGGGLWPRPQRGGGLRPPLSVEPFLAMQLCGYGLAVYIMDFHGFLMIPCDSMISGVRGSRPVPTLCCRDAALKETFLRFLPAGCCHRFTDSSDVAGWAGWLAGWAGLGWVGLAGYSNYFHGFPRIS